MAMNAGVFFHQNTWSTLRLIELCEELSVAELEAPTVAAYGSVLDTLVHLLACEHRYIRRLGGPAAAEPLTEGEKPSFDVMRRAARANGETLAAMAGSVMPGSVLSGVTEYGLPFETDPAVFLVQAVNHSTGHRMQIVGILSTLGLGPPDLDEELDAWSWGVATGALRPGSV